MVIKKYFVFGLFVLLGGAAASADEATSAEAEIGTQQYATEHLTQKSIHDDSWWRPAYIEAAVNNDCTKAMAILHRAQKVGNIRSHTQLGQIYRRGACGDKDITRAETLLRYSAERGDAWAAAYLAQILFIDKGQDDPSAKEWAHRARFSMMKLGAESWKKAIPFLHIDEPLSPHLKQALSWLEKTEAKDSPVLFEIGKDLLEHGTWPESKVLACYWLNKAAIKGHVRASYLVARQLILGEGVLIAPLTGTNRLAQAVEGEDVDAYLFAAQILERGQVANQSYYHAYIALMRAQDLGADVKQAIDRVASKLSDFERKSIIQFPQHTSKYPRILSPIGQNTPPGCTYASR